MKHILALLLCLILVPTIVLGGLAGIVYFTFFNPTPTEYPLLHSVEDVVSVEYAHVKLVEGELQGVGLGYVEDIDAFMTDFLSVDCYDGISYNSVSKITSDSITIDGFIINYADGSYEIVSIYISANSTLSVDSLADLFKQKFYSFDQEGFKSLIDTYKVDISTDNPVLPS